MRSFKLLSFRVLSQQAPAVDDLLFGPAPTPPPMAVQPQRPAQDPMAGVILDLSAPGAYGVPPPQQQWPAQGGPAPRQSNTLGEFGDLLDLNQRRAPAYGRPDQPRGSGQSLGAGTGRGFPGETIHWVGEK